MNTAASGTGFSREGLARLVLSNLAVCLANTATVLVSTRNDPDCANGGRASEANSLGDYAEQVLIAAVVFERERGCSWDDLARYLGTTAEEAERRFGPALAAWQDALEGRTAGGPPHGLRQAVQDPEYVGSYLDSWAYRHLSLTKDRYEVTGRLLGIPGPGEDGWSRAESL